MDCSEHSSTLVTIRILLVPLGAIVLVEFVILSFVYYYAFGYKLITASTVSHKTPSTENLEGGGPDFSLSPVSSASAGDSGKVGQGARFSLGTFLGDVLRLHDVIGVLSYRSELYTPLGADE